MKDQLKKLLEKVDPTVMTEAVKAELVALMESKLKESHEKGFEAGYTKGQDEIKRLDEEHAQKFEEALNTLDADHCTKLNKLVETMETVHDKKLTESLEKQDADHSAKFQEVMEKIDREHTKKLEKVVKKLKESKNKKLVEKISAYLDVILEEVIPSKTTIDYVKMSRLEEMQKQLKKILVINEDFIQDEIKEALVDAKNQIDEKVKYANDLLAEKIDLKSIIKTHEATQLLEKVTSDMPETKKLFIKKFFAKADAKEISGKLNEAVKAFEKDAETMRNKVIEENKNKATKVKVPTITESVDSSKTEPIAENIPVTRQGSSGMNEYVRVLNKSLSARK